ncbi:MAG: hypothetical protein AAFV19_03860 [Pseudomonadota bacterium]
MTAYIVFLCIGGLLMLALLVWILSLKVGNARKPRSGGRTHATHASAGYLAGPTGGDYSSGGSAGGDGGGGGC